MDTENKGLEKDLSFFNFRNVRLYIYIYTHKHISTNIICKINTHLYMHMYYIII